LARAVLEGVSFGLRDSLESMRELGMSLAQVRASGGGARSSLWRQILADVFATDIVRVNVMEGAAYGAALLAGTGTGIYAGVEDACARTIHLTDTTCPSLNTRVYADYYQLYHALYPSLAPHFKSVSVVTTKYA
jgi:xylulokinase